MLDFLFFDVIISTYLMHPSLAKVLENLKYLFL